MTRLGGRWSWRLGALATGFVLFAGCGGPEEQASPLPASGGANHSAAGLGGASGGRTTTGGSAPSTAGSAGLTSGGASSDHAGDMGGQAGEAAADPTRRGDGGAGAIEPMSPDDGGSPPAGGGGDLGAGGNGGESAHGTELGTVAGACHQIDLAAIQSPAPNMIQNSIDLGPLGFAVSALSESGKEVYTEALGGSSAAVQALSYELLSSCESGLLVKTSDQIAYDTPSPRIDYTIAIAGEVLAVSVIRAFAYPDDSKYTQQTAAGGISKKLTDLQLSTAGVSTKDRWQKGIVHVIARSAETATTALAAYAALDVQITRDAVFVVTVTDGVDDAIY